MSMPTNKHKRKASASKSKSTKNEQQLGLISSHPKAFVMVGMFFVVLGIYLLAFESQDNAMFGLAMISLVAGAATSIFAKISLVKKTAK